MFSGNISQRSLNFVNNNNILLQPIEKKKNHYVYQNHLKSSLITGLFIALFMALPAVAKAEKDSCWKPNNNFQKHLAAGSYTCPYVDYSWPLEPQYFETMNVLMQPKVQDFILKKKCPYDSPGYVPTHQASLWTGIANHEDYPLMLNYLRKPMNQEFEDLDKNIYNHTFSFQGTDILEAAIDNKIDIATLLSKRDTQEPTKIKLFNSLKNMRLAKPKDVDVALMIMSHQSSDPTGFISLNRFLNVGFKEYTTWQKISKKHPIHFEEISTVSELYSIAEKVKKLFNNIKLIVFYSHGFEKLIQLSDNNFYNMKTANLATNSNPRLPIDEDGTIIFNSCLTGKDGLYNPYNLVNQMAAMHPGVTVLGANVTGAIQLNIIDLNQNKFELKDNNALNENISYRVKAEICSILPDWADSLLPNFISKILREYIFNDERCIQIKEV